MKIDKRIPSTGVGKVGGTQAKSGGPRASGAALPDKELP